MPDEPNTTPCRRCGSLLIWVPTFCNFGHCAECFAPCDPEHECNWDGTEHESYGPSNTLPGNVTVQGDPK